MAANSTLLALQCGAAGVPVPRSHLRRNLVSKAHKTAIMAANPAMQYEASVLVSMPRQLHRSSVIPKRNKTVVAAYPGLKVEVIPGVPEYTKGELYNFSGEPIRLDDKSFWEGSQSVTLPKRISHGETGEFEQRAGSRGSIGGLEYVFSGDEYKWIIAWSNAKDDLNKVYTQILREDADWIQIRESLDKSGQTCIFHGQEHNNIPYSSSVEIDKTSPTPTLRAILKKEKPFPPPFPVFITTDLISGKSAKLGDKASSGGDADKPEKLQVDPPPKDEEETS